MFKIKTVLTVACIAVIACTHSASVYSENGKGKGQGKGNGNGGSAVIGYSIAPNSCAVTVTSTKDISNIVIKDDSGNTIKKWDNLSGGSFANFGMYAAYLPDSQLHVKSGNNGKRGLGAEIGDQFRSDLLACLEPACPFDDLIDVASGSVIIDLDTGCSLASTTTPGALLEVFDCRAIACSPELSGEIWFVRREDANGVNDCSTHGNPVATPGGIGPYDTSCGSSTIDGRVNVTQARACAVAMGCSQFDIPD